MKALVAKLIIRRGGASGFSFFFSFFFYSSFSVRYSLPLEKPQDRSCHVRFGQRGDHRGAITLCCISEEKVA
jgi:hypothetical protein